MNDNLNRAVDAFSASAAIRARNHVLTARPAYRPPVIILPPGAGLEGESDYAPAYDAAAAAERDGHSLAGLIRTRQQAAFVVERLLAFLDATEGESDLEDDTEDDHFEEEASLGWIEGEPNQTRALRPAKLDHLVDHELDDSDLEPLLGFLEPHLRGDICEWWYPYTDEARQDVHQGNADDRELDVSDDELSLCGIGAHWVPNAASVEDGESEADDEWSLGSISRAGGDQTLWADGHGGDLEDSSLGNDDREDVNEDGDGSPDDESSLGWTERVAQGGNSWFDAAAADDRELQDHVVVDEVKARARRSKGKTKPRTIVLATNVIGNKRVKNLTKRQFALVEARDDRYDPVFQSPTPNTSGLRL